MKKLFCLLLCLSLECAFGETIIINKCVNQMCGFKLGEKIKTNNYVMTNKVKWIKQDKSINCYYCFPPINFMDAKFCAVSTLNDGRIAAIMLIWDDSDSLDLDKRMKKFIEIRKRLAIILAVPLEKLMPIEEGYSYTSNFIYKSNNDEIGFVLKNSEDGIITLGLSSTSMEKIYNKENEIRIRQKALNEDAKAFGL